MAIKYTHTEISIQAKAYYRVINILGMRKTLISRIENGISDHKKQRLGIDFQVEDTERDAHSLEILTSWKKITKQERLDYCQWLVDTSDEVYMFAMQKKENLKQGLRNKNPFRRKTK